MSSKVDHPAHYGGADNSYEVIKVLRAWLTPQEYCGFCKGNIIKYDARAAAKNGLEDHEKALWYQRALVDFVRAIGHDAIYPPPRYWSADGEFYEDEHDIVACAPLMQATLVSCSVEPHARFVMRYLIDDVNGEWEHRWFDDSVSADQFIESAKAEGPR